MTFYNDFDSTSYDVDSFRAALNTLIATQSYAFTDVYYLQNSECSGTKFNTVNTSGFSFNQRFQVNNASILYSVKTVKFLLKHQARIRILITKRKPTVSIREIYPIYRIFNCGIVRIQLLNNNRFMICREAF